MPGGHTAEEAKRQRFEGWVREYGAAILRACFVYLVDKTQAEDAAQDSLLKAWTAMDRFEQRGPASEKAWLMRIAINVCRDYHRSKWFRHVDARRALEDLPDRFLLQPEEDRTLFLDILRLPVKLKQVIMLHYYHGLTLRQTGEALGIALSTVHHRLRKAEQLLRITLTGGEDDEG